jgi:4-carboxymuconolactone decarboxylase
MNNPEVMKELYGEYADELGHILEGLDPEFANIIRDFPYKTIWSREGLSLKERSISTISSLIAMGREDQTEIHMRGFLNSGGTIKELKELIIHLSVYSGFPSSLNAFKILNKVTSNNE